MLARTSNPEGPQFQHARLADGRTVAQAVVDDLAARNAGAPVLGSLGVVVGATIGDVDLDLDALHGPVLVPGIGAQGGGGRRRPPDLRHRAPAPCCRARPARCSGTVPTPRALKIAARELSDSFGFLRAG